LPIAPYTFSIDVSANKVVVCRSCHDDKGYLTLKDWLRKLRRENDPREPIVKAFRAARKVAEALLAA